MVSLLYKYFFRYKIIRYLVSGGMGATVHVGTFHVLYDFYDIWYQYATTAGFLLAVSVSFTMQKFFTFQDHRKEVLGSQSLIFFIIATTNLGLNNTLMYIFVEHIHIMPTLAQICAALLLAISSFLLYSRLFTSRPKHTEVYHSSPEQTEQ